MLGATVIVTSGSDDKLARAKALGADHLINYRTTPEWAKVALEITGGLGVDHIVEVGGKDTLNQSIEAAAAGGKVVIIGLLSGLPGQAEIVPVFRKNLRVVGISVGSRHHFTTTSRRCPRRLTSTS